MKIKVISLANSIERRKSIQRQFQELAVRFDFFDAVTPSQARKHVHHYDEKQFFLNSGRHATETEIACYASHLALWKQCADDSSPYLILEDDAKLDSSFLGGLLVAASQINKLGFIRVSLPNTGTALAIKRIGPFDIQYCRRVPLLALGYALSPPAARRLADAATVVEEPVDKFLQRFWRHGQPVYAVTPPFVHLTALAEESDIGTRLRPKYTLSSWTLRAMRKVQNSVFRTTYNFKFIHDTLRGHAVHQKAVIHRTWLY
jgi:glycosyl transferase family 25